MIGTRTRSTQWCSSCAGCAQRKKLEAALAAASKQRNITINTMQNYTRFPLAVLEWSGWTEKQRRSDVYKKPIVFHGLTSQGDEKVAWLGKAIDLRANDLTTFSLPCSRHLLV